MGYTIADVEDAIVLALQGSDLADTCQTIASYHGELEDLVKAALSLTAPIPSVYVLYAGSKFSEVVNRGYDDEQAFTIVAIAKNLRGGEDLKSSIYGMLELFKATLIDNDLSLDIEPLHPVAIEAVAVTKIFSIYAFDIKTSFAYDR